MSAKSDSMSVRTQHRELVEARDNLPESVLMLLTMSILEMEFRLSGAWWQTLLPVDLSSALEILYYHLKR